MIVAVIMDATHKGKHRKQKVIDPEIGNLLIEFSPRRPIIIFFPLLDFSKIKSVHSVNSFWFIAGLVYVVVIANIASEIAHHVPNLSNTPTAVIHELNFL